MPLTPINFARNEYSQVIPSNSKWSSSPVGEFLGHTVYFELLNHFQGLCSCMFPTTKDKGPNFSTSWTSLIIE